MMQRRGFLASILAAGFAPAAVGSAVLMPVRQVLRLWGDGIHDDTEALQARLSQGGTFVLPRGTYRITNTLELTRFLRCWGPS